MKHLLSSLLCILITAATHAQQSLKEIYLLREKGKTFLQEKKYDSAAHYFSTIITNTTYANATDHLSLSLSRLQLRDTVAFRQQLIHSIENGGADSAIIHFYFRPLDSVGRIFLGTVYTALFPPYHALFLQKVDPRIEQEMKEIAYLDQVCRRQEDMQYNQLHKNDTTTANRQHIKAIGRYIDSVNYLRVLNLIEQNKYPGFHNFGITASNYSPILMHISDHNETQWNVIHNFLKQQVHAGNIMPNEVVAIATRHYQQKGCTYYGSIKWGLTKPCDCAQVDKFRTEIGLDNLKQEYERLKQKLPDCYQ